MEKSSKILVTGGDGFLGQHLLSELERQGYTSIHSPSQDEVDLLVPAQCEEVIKGVEVVINAAGYLGGTVENRDYPADFFYINAMMGIHLMHAARRSKLKKFIQLGTVISYPQNVARWPVREDELWSGYPDLTKEGYAMAKKFLLVMGNTYRRQYKIPVVHLLLTNMYGPGDHFRSPSAHVVPALIDRFWDAKVGGQDEVVVWGTGRATRDFLYVGDAARAIVAALDKYDGSEPVNIASGREVSIKQLAMSITKEVKFTGSITWDTTKPDGPMRSWYDVSRARDVLGWQAQVSFDAGMRQTVEWYARHVAEAVERETDTVLYK